MKKIMIAGLATLIATPMTAMAYEAGDMLVRVGATHVQGQDSYAPDGVHAKSEDTQLGLNLVYMATNSIGIELLAASPFKHDIKAQVPGLGFYRDVIGSTKHLPPTLSVQYYIDNSSIVTPYVGAGINYTIFFNEDLKEAGIDNIELKNSTGLALQVGMDIELSKSFGLNVDVRQIDIDTEVDSKVALVDGIDVEVDPTVYSITAYYKF